MLALCRPAKAQVDYFTGAIHVGGRQLIGPLFTPVIPYPYSVPNGSVTYLGDGSDAVLPPDPRLVAAANWVAANALPRTPDSIDARMDKQGKLLISWKGDPSVVDHIAFAILDKDRKAIKETIITRLPAEARFTLTNKTSFYRVIVTYVNGMTSIVTSPV